ncbi:MAG TPA: hypothetical protein P5299_01330 [Candidatus Woesebacteria bacterium]|nr:hypothetical protein [Candidatus Woesebacteria bacterium]HRT39993.1 hypothetical protein [Candidatus Woesebacteria bacterium]
MRYWKTIILNLILAYIGITAIINIINQYNLLKGAKKRNSQLQEQITKLIQENEELKLKIKQVNGETSASTK